MRRPVPLAPTLVVAGNGNLNGQARQPPVLIGLFVGTVCQRRWHLSRQRLEPLVPPRAGDFGSYVETEAEALVRRRPTVSAKEGLKQPLCDNLINRVNFRLLLTSIAAAVIGGVSLFGGRGEVRGAFIGALVIATVSNGLNTAGYATGVIYMVTGAILLFAVTLDTIARRLQVRSGR